MKWHNISNLLDGLGKFVFNGRSYKAQVYKNVIWNTPRKDGYAGG